MNMKKILKIAAKIVVGIFVLYLLIGFVVLPLAISWGIKSQGTKILKHPVSVKWVQFNPILLNLTIKGFEIRDVQKKVMVGFDKFYVDVSFVSLMKKIYRIESLELDGLNIQAALLPDGKINLMDLLPHDAGVSNQEPQTVEKPQSVNPAEGGVQTKPKPTEMPIVIIDAVNIHKGSINFTDQSVNPNFKTSLNNIEINITGVSTKPESQAKIIFGAKLDDKGIISTEVLISPFAQPLNVETTFSLDNYALDILTPYVGKYSGRTLKDGKLTLKMDYRIADNKLTASHKVLIQRFEFGQKVESKDALHVPFGLVVGLLEDPQGRIKIALPVTGDMSDPQFEYFHLIGQVVRNFFVKLVTKPFSFLASVIGSDSGTDELGSVRFLPGKAELSEAEQTKLKTLVAGLNERPKLRLEINGSYDPEIDWKAIKTEVFAREYASLTKESTRTEAWVYQELYQRRFGIRSLWTLTKKYKSKDGEYNETALKEEIKRQLIENASADKVALDVLAASRAKIVYDAMIAAGFDLNRVMIGQSRKVQASMGYIPLEFTLTVFGETDQPAEESSPVGGV